MKILDYQEAIKEFCVYPDALTRRKAEFDYLALGLCSEAGEVAGKIKKLYRDREMAYWNLSHDKKAAVRDELGDTLFYLTMMATVLELSLEEIAEHNHTKLSNRKAAGTLKGEGDNR